MGKLESVRVMDRIGGNQYGEPVGEIRFHVLPEDCFALKSALGSVTLDAKVVKELIESYARGVIIERMKAHNLEAVITQNMERRIEVAIKTVTSGLEADLINKIREIVLSRAAGIAAELPLTIRVEIGQSVNTTH